LRLIEELKTKGVSAAEMKLAKASLVNGTAFMGNTPEKRVENAVLETTLSLPPGFMKTWGRELKQVTETAVNDALKSFVAPEDLAILVLGTSTPELLEQVAQAAGVKRQDVRVIQYTDDIAK
jgi:predicted Zn-dependent peptidase